MKILNIHGYKGSPLNSACTALNEIDHEIVSPSFDFDNTDPNEVLKSLELIVRYKGVKLIIGSSLGGFFAAVLASRVKLPVILINPCLMPFLHLPRLGYTGDILGYTALFSEIAKLDPGYVKVIVGAKDEVIDTHDFTLRLFPNATVMPEGMHSGATLDLKTYFSKLL